jgi:Kelch motif
MLHQSAVVAGAFSPDGKTIPTARQQVGLSCSTTRGWQGEAGPLRQLAYMLASSACENFCHSFCEERITMCKRACILAFTISLVICLSAAAPSQIAKFPPLPQAVSSFGADVVDGWLYVYGGHVVSTHDYSTASVLGAFRRLKLADPQAWEELPSGMGLQGLALVAHNGKLYRIGGMQPRNQAGEKTDNHSIASCARYDPATKIWENLPDLPDGRSSHDAVVVGDKLFVIGGWNMNGAGKKNDWHDTALVLDLKKDPLKWQAILQPFQRRALITASLAGKVYVIGGLTAAGEIELTVNVFDPEKNSWTQGPAVPGPSGNGFSPASCVLNNRLYISVADGKLYRLAGMGEGQVWEEAGALKQPRIVHRMVATAAGQLITIGGAYKGSNIASLEVIAAR